MTTPATLMRSPSLAHSGPFGEREAPQSVASPSYFLSQAFSSQSLSPKSRSSPDLTTPRSTAPPRGLSSRKSPPSFAGSGETIIGTAADDMSGFFAAAATQNRSFFSLPNWGASPSTPQLASSLSPRVEQSPRSESPQSFLSSPSGAVAGPSALATGPARRSSAGRLHASTRFAPVSPAEVVTLLDEKTLVLDLRPHAAFVSSAGHIVDSINICVPTTLLRRSNYSLTRVAETLVKAERHRLLDSVKRCHRIIVLDQDTTTLHQDGTLHALLAKFERENFKGDLMWLKGGYMALRASISDMDTPIIVHASDGSGSSGSSSLSLGNSLFNSSSSSLSSATSEDSSASSSKRSGSPVLRCSDLPAAAFQASSTQQYIQDQGAQPGNSKFDFQFSEAGQKVHSANTRQVANPFFDNIRQNQESLNEGRSMENLQPFEVPAVFVSNKEARARLPPFLRDLVDLPPLQRAELLAREFFSIESREQHRLQDLMSWHAAQNQDAGRNQDFNPLSISAGVEKGHLNRYRNVFPYEHTRVRLEQHGSLESDYINASRIDLRGSTHSYIATQGPMASSFDDFWQLIYQEQINVIVMLTNLREAGREKCGAYYRPGRYGKITVETVQACSAASAEDERATRAAPSAGGFFGAAQSPGSASGTLRRTLRVTHADEPGQSRLVRHLHFASWPDFDVPPHPHEIVALVNEVNEAKAGSRAPVLAHCSAGVGRTGCFIALDVLLDSILHPEAAAEPMATDEDASHGGLLPSRSRRTPPVASSSPVHAVINEMREQRMNMVANAGQFRFIYTALLDGLASGLP